WWGWILPENGNPFLGTMPASADSLQAYDPPQAAPARIDAPLPRQTGTPMDELNGRMIACQILITGLIARVANSQRDPLTFLTEFRDEIRAVVKGVNIVGMENTERVRYVAQQTVDELFSLMKPPSSD